MLKVMPIFGTRPEAIKMAPIVQKLKEHADEIETVVCVTGQHRQMLDQVLHLFDIQPDIDLNLMQPGQSLSLLTASIIQKLDPIIQEQQPDWILVQGDTTTVMAASLVAFYHRVKIGHVEAGLRTNDKWQPFPEEINRRVAGVVADYHFAPTIQSKANLLNEGIADSNILVTGNPVIDALLQVSEKPYDFDDGPLCNIPFDRKVILVTAHRRENFGQPILDICQALLDLVAHYGERIHIVYPVHLNPNIQKPVSTLLGNCPDITLLNPLDYLPLIQLMKRSTIVLTDSGGLQEEAPGLGKPVLVLRDVTERPEGVQAGTVRLVGTNPRTIFDEVRLLLDSPAEYERMAKAVNPYGDGFAAEKIVSALVEHSEREIVYSE